MTMEDFLAADERAYLLDRVEQLERTNRSLEKRTYAAPHVWNLVAKTIREDYPTPRSYAEYVSTTRMEHPFDGKTELRVHRRVLEDLALAFAKRFSEDEGFDPITWLDKCSPDPDLYPLSELWEDADTSD